MSIPDWLDPLLDAEESRHADSTAINDLGIDSCLLMERAAAGLSELIHERLPNGRIAVLVGKGNNGGDGLAAARLLRELGRTVDVIRVCEETDWANDAQRMFDLLEGVRPTPFDGAVPTDADVIVDCLLGTGFSGEVREPLGEAITAINRSRESGAKVVACDIPSGVDGSTGECAGVGVEADMTVTFNLGKTGLWVHPGKRHAGAVEVVGIGIPLGVVEPAAGLISARAVAGLPLRGPASDKFAAGSVIVAGGSPGLTGAPLLAGLGAARAGAGYVTVALPAGLLAASDEIPEIMGCPLAEHGHSHCTEGVVGLMRRAERAGSLVLGPGLGRSASAMAFAKSSVHSVACPLVLDADALHAFAGLPEEIAERKGVTVLTPHAGELAVLLGMDRPEVEARRLACARLAAQRSGAAVVLKGDDTIIAMPDARVAVSRGDSPALATAGSGDVLGGAVGALLAAGVGAFRAASAAVLIHAQAGRVAGREGSQGVMARDIANAIPRARDELAPEAGG